MQHVLQKMAQLTLICFFANFLIGCSPSTSTSPSNTTTPSHDAHDHGHDHDASHDHDAVEERGPADEVPSVDDLDDTGEADDTDVSNNEDDTDEEVVTSSDVPTDSDVDAANQKSIVVNEPIQVLLPSSDLTSGIPGEGSLSVDQIRAWIEQPENHVPLAVVLPIGLVQGAGQVFIPADNPLTRAKIELGRQLYFDTRMSGDGTIACASCHHPDHGYTKPDQFGVGINGQTGNRNSPISYNRILSVAQFWDGRATSLEDQAKGPIQSPIEHGTNHEDAVAVIAAVEGYQIQFEKVFGADSINIDNIAKAIASFERIIVTGPSNWDYAEQFKPFLEYDDEDLEEIKQDDPDLYTKYETAKAAFEANQMSESAQRGRDLFFSDRVGCTACHVGANFTDEKYHNLGVGMDVESPDLGRFAQTNEEKDQGAFKTPTIRNVVLTGPYMHDGSQATLEEVVEWYNKGGHPNPQLSEKIKKIDLSDQEKKYLVEFMKALTGDFPVVEQGRLP